MTAGSSMLAKIRMAPPQRAQVVVTSTEKTLMRRCAQVIAVQGTPLGDYVSSPTCHQRVIESAFARHGGVLLPSTAAIALFKMAVARPDIMLEAGAGWSTGSVKRTAVRAGNVPPTPASTVTSGTLALPEALTTACRHAAPASAEARPQKKKTPSSSRFRKTGEELLGGSAVDRKSPLSSTQHVRL